MKVATIGNVLEEPPAIGKVIDTLATTKFKEMKLEKVQATRRLELRQLNAPRSNRGNA